MIEKTSIEKTWVEKTQIARTWIEKMWAWFRRSATLVWARVQYMAGLVGAGLIVAFSGYDFTTLASLDWQAAFKILVAVAISGVLTELARRRTLPRT